MTLYPAIERETFVLAKLEMARRAMAEAQSLPEVKQIRDMAEALRQYVKQPSDSLDIQNQAAEIKLRAERRAGELLAASTMHGGDRKSSAYDRHLKLRDIGIEHHQSQRWQQIAALPEPTFETYIADALHADISTQV